MDFDIISARGVDMAAVTVRSLPDETHRALKVQAARHGRSTEAEIRSILVEAVRPQVRMGSALRAIGSNLGGIDLDVRRDRSRVRKASFT
jgi:antitoxin FitA